MCLIQGVLRVLTFLNKGKFYFACVKCIDLHPNNILIKNIIVQYTQKGKGLRAIQIHV